MNKKLKKILATVSAMSVCAVSMVSVSAGALYTPTDKTVTSDTTSFSATIYNKTVKFHLWQEATDYFDDENTKIYISDKLVNDFGEEYTYEIVSYHQLYQGKDYYSTGLMGFGSYLLDTKENFVNLEEYLSANNIAYGKLEYTSDDGGVIDIECYTETSDGEIEPIYTDDEYFQLLQKIKEDTGCIASWVSPATTVTITDVEIELPEPTLAGDANEDGEVNISDAVLIMQSITNPSEYTLTIQGMANADVVDNDGITLLDALRIQEMQVGK